MLAKFRTRLRQKIFILRRDYFTLNNLFSFFALVICVYSTFDAISSINRNLQLRQKLSTLNVERARLDLEVQTLNFEQEYYQSDEYLELIARAKQGKMNPGETMLIMAPNSEFAKNRHSTEVAHARKKTNFELWIEFLFGHSI